MGKRKTKLEIGKFYHMYGGNVHPAYIFEKNKTYGTYIAIKTGTTKRPDMIEIKPIQKGKKSFVHKRPYEGTRKDYGDRELNGLQFNADDNLLIEEIKKRKPILTKSAKKKHGK